MSWDAYVTNLTANGALEYAAIIGLDGNIWASNLGVAVLPTYNTEVPDEKNPDATTHV
jgi:profilin